MSINFEGIAEAKNVDVGAHDESGWSFHVLVEDGYQIPKKREKKMLQLFYFYFYFYISTTYSHYSMASSCYYLSLLRLPQRSLVFDFFTARCFNAALFTATKSLYINSRNLY